MQTLETPLKRSATADVSYWTCWTKWFCFNNIALFTTRTKDFARFPRVTIRRKVRNSTHWHPQKRWKKRDGKIRNPMHHFAEFWLFLNVSALLPFFPRNLGNIISSQKPAFVVPWPDDRFVVWFLWSPGGKNREMSILLEENAFTRDLRP